MSSDDPFPRQRLVTMQIIAAALPMGVLAFFGIVTFIVYGGGNPRPAAGDGLPILTITAGVLLLVTGSLSFVMPGVVTQAALKQIAAGGEQNDVTRLFGVKQTSMIIGMALLVAKRR